MRVRDIAQPDSRFFLKSEYGPLSESWAAMSFSRPQLKTQLTRRYRQGIDFIVYAATGGPETREPEHRARLLSILKIDLTRTHPTEQLIPKERWDWAQEHYPGQWERSFGVVEGWNIDDFPLASGVAPDSYPRIGKHPNQGMTLEMNSQEREALLDFSISPVSLPKRSALQDALTLDALRRDPILNQEAVRIAELVFNRVNASGTLQRHTAPTRSAPSGFILSVAEMLRNVPLICGLCGGVMYIGHANRLLRPSPDRIDSVCESYGPDNFHLAHLACNLAKNDVTVVQFEEWLEAVKEVPKLDSNETRS